MPEEAEGGRREEEVGSKSGYFVRTLDQPRREPTECKKEAPRMRRTARPLCCVTAVHHSRMQATPPARRAAWLRPRAFAPPRATWRWRTPGRSCASGRGTTRSSGEIRRPAPPARVARAVALPARLPSTLQPTSRCSRPGVSRVSVHTGKPALTPLRRGGSLAPTGLPAPVRGRLGKLLRWSSWPPALQAAVHALYPAIIVYQSAQRLRPTDRVEEARRCG